MERVKGIGGVFFKATGDREQLLGWYRDHLGLEAEPWGGVVFAWRQKDRDEDGSTTWSIFPSDTTYFGDPTSTHMINYRVDDLGRMLEQLRAAGAKVDERVEETEFGRFGWTVDPHGNRFELWQPAPGL
jgi:predicted enzyme related to lactoylglutathione lyase